MTRIGGMLALVVAALATSFEPAHLNAGAPVPGAPGNVVGGGEVWLELGISTGGGVNDVVTLRETPPFTDALRASVERWSFEAARQEGTPVNSHVLVVGAFRPPTLAGPSIGELPRDVGAASADVAVPTQSSAPAYPANAVGEASVLVEATVGQNGRVSAVRALSGPEPFSGATLAAVREWQFKPATRDGVPVPATVCVVASFRTPVVGAPPAPPPPPKSRR
jgi:TonB family protein